MATHTAHPTPATPSVRPAYNVGHACRGIAVSIAIIVAVFIALLLI